RRSRLAALEQRVERLTSVLIIQSVLLAAVVLMWALRTAPWIALFLLIAFPVLVFYRQSLPGWARALGRLVAQFRTPKQSTVHRKKSLSRSMNSAASDVEC